MLDFGVNGLFLHDTILYCRNKNLPGHEFTDGHFQIQPSISGSHTRIYRCPVGHQDTFESPLLAQYINVQPAVFGGMHPVQRIIAIHDRPYSCFLHSFSERGKINFLQRAFIHIRAGMMSAPLLVIGCKMLHRSHDSLFLHSQDIFFSCFARQIRVFTKILIVSPA